jgi:hypothetical protein
MTAREELEVLARVEREARHNMDGPLYQILCENNLADDQVIVALTSRDICSVAAFLERGEDSLKDVYAKWLECSLSEEDFKFFELVTPCQCRKLTNILETMREAKQQKSAPVTPENFQGTFLGVDEDEVY